MLDNLQTESSPALSEETRKFVRCALQSKLIQVASLKKTVASLLIESPNITPKRLADGLVGGGMLTQWQANKLLSGKNRGFHLGSYRLLRPLGKGGMGVVYLGEHDVMQRLMALKIMPPESTQDERRIERFKQEARAAAQLDHPNIVRAYDFAKSDDKLFIAMEYVDGIDLHQAVLRDGKLSVAAALDVLSQAAMGLAHAHERGIIHRDIKPSNLMLRTDGTVKISDMGLARVGWEDPATNNASRLLGSVDFMAPEQAINSGSVDARADIYSLGCTLYYLLTGRGPFASSNPQQRQPASSRQSSGQHSAQTLARHQTQPAPDVRDLRPDCPAAIAQMLLRMMAKRPDDRPKSAGDLLAWIKQVDAGRGGTIATNQTLRGLSPDSDTVCEADQRQNTLDDSSPLPSDGEDSLRDSIGALWDDLDVEPMTATFESSHDRNVGSHALDSNSAFRGTYKNPHLRTTQTSSDKTGVDRSTGNDSSKSKRLSFIGIAIASTALLIVVATLAYSVIRTKPPHMPKFQDVSDGKGGHMIIVHD